MTHDKHAVNTVSLGKWARPSRRSRPVAKTRVCEGLAPSACALRANSVRPPALAYGLFMGPSANAGCAVRHIEQLARDLTAFFLQQ